MSIKVYCDGSESRPHRRTWVAQFMHLTNDGRLPTIGIPLLPTDHEAGEGTWYAVPAKHHAKGRRRRAEAEAGSHPDANTQLRALEGRIAAGKLPPGRDTSVTDLETGPGMPIRRNQTIECRSCRPPLTLRGEKLAKILDALDSSGQATVSLGSLRRVLH